MEKESAKIILSADSTCDLDTELKERYHVHYFPLHIILDGHDYKDGIDITPEEIFQKYYDEKILPKTAAVNVAEYIDHFEPWVRAGYEVIHINLGSSLSSAYQNCCIAAEELGHVHVIDSCSLSSGTGLLVRDAGEMIRQGMSADAIADVLRQRTVGKKYRGSLDKVLVKYVKDQLAAHPDIDPSFIFITHSGIAAEYIHLVKEALKAEKDFAEIHVTTACCTISSHCGPNTLGILFETK